MTKIWPIAVNAFVQTIRQPIFSILILLIICMLVLITAVTGFSMQTDISVGDTKLMVDSALATLMSFALFLAVFSASAVLSREIESRTVLTVVTKPVPRSTIMLGKLLGVAAAVTLGYYLASTVLILNARHGVISAASNHIDPVVMTFGLGALGLSMAAAVFCNYFFSFNVCGSFITSAAVLFTLALLAVGNINRDWRGTEYFLEGIDMQIPVLLGLIWMASMIMTTMAVAISTRLNSMATLGVCYGIFLLALMTENVFKVHADTNMLAKLAWILSPNLTYLFTLDSLTMGQTISGRYILLSGGYTLCYCTGLALLGMALFQTREMDSREDGASAPMLVNFYAWAMRIVAATTIIGSLVIFGGAQISVQIPQAAGLIAAGLILWALAGYFGRGIGWSLWLVVLAAVAQFTFSVVVRASGLMPGLTSNIKYALLVIAFVNLAYVGVMLLRKSTRSHFSYKSDRADQSGRG